VRVAGTENEKGVLNGEDEKEDKIIIGLLLRRCMKRQLLPAPLHISSCTQSRENCFAPFKNLLLHFSFRNISETSFPEYVL